jgi:hypothetical protein
LTKATPSITFAQPGPVTVGQSVTFSATVTSSLNPDCTGCFSFHVGTAGGTLIGSAVNVSGGAATLDFTTGAGALPNAGTFTIVAVYAQSALFNQGTASASLRIDPVLSSTTLATPSTVTLGQQVTLNVTASPDCTNTCMSFHVGSAGGTRIGSAVNVSSGVATLNFTTGAGALPNAGTFTIFAVYAGSSPNLSGSSDSKSLTINPVTSSTSITASSSVTVGGNISLDAHVTAAFSPTCTGCLTFHVGSPGGTQIGTAQNVAANGNVTSQNFTTGGSAIPDPGTYTIFAVYDPTAVDNPNVSGSSSSGASLTVNAIVSTVSLAVSPNGAGTTTDSYTLTATIGPGGLGTQTGTVQFKANGVNLGVAVTVSGGSAALTTTLPVGSPTALTAIFTSTNVDYTTGVTSNTVNRNIT